MRTYPSVFRVWGEAVSPGKCPSHLRSQGLCANENIDGGRGVGRGTQPEQQCSNDSDHSGHVRSTYLFLNPMWRDEEAEDDTEDRKGAMCLSTGADLSNASETSYCSFCCFLLPILGNTQPWQLHCGGSLAAGSALEE